MCGIAGWISPQSLFESSVLNQICAAIAHRGPDAHGTWLSDDKTIALGHRRLSIIDPVSTSDQPMHDKDANLTLIYNGEIYNYPELRTELETLGHIFRTSSDTEVLLKSYKQWGEDCLHKFNGMFAFAIWDDRNKTLFCARDRMGQKPFFYRRLKDGGIAFASEPQALVNLPNHHDPIDHQAMQSFLVLGYTTSDNTCHRNIKRLPPAHTMHVNAEGQTTRRKYWDILKSFGDKQNITQTEASEQIIALIDDATKIRMRADVPYGAFLSAGIDSNAIVASMIRQNNAEPIRTFTIGFDKDSGYDESQIAAQSAQHFSTNHTRITVPNDIDAITNIMHDAAHEPLADASFIPMHELARQTSQHVKMVLTGDGGDELFAGYPTYIADTIHKKISPFIPFIPPLPIPKKRRSKYFKLYQFLNGLPLDAGRAHFSWRVCGSRQLWIQLLHNDNELNWDEIYAPFVQHYDDAKHLSPLDQSLYVDMKTFLVDSVLVKADRATMLHGLEARAPLLDYRIAEFAARLPTDLKLKFSRGTFQGKYILRQSQKPRLPEFLYTQPKRGFSMPISDLLANDAYDIMQRALNTQSFQTYFDQSKLQNMINAHKNGKADYGLPLYNMMTMAIHMQKETGA